MSQSNQLRAALAKCQAAADNVPSFARSHLVPVSDFLAIVVQEIEELKARLALTDELLAETVPERGGEGG